MFLGNHKYPHSDVLLLLLLFIFPLDLFFTKREGERHVEEAFVAARLVNNIKFIQGLLGEVERCAIRVSLYYTGHLLNQLLDNKASAQPRRIMTGTGMEQPAE